VTGRPGPAAYALRFGACRGGIETARLGSCDDCGFAPFGDDTSTSRDTAFAKIRARVQGTQLAASKLGL